MRSTIESESTGRCIRIGISHGLAEMIEKSIPFEAHTPDILNVLVHKRDFPILFMNSASWRHIAIQFTNLEQLQTRSHDWMPATHSQLWLTEWVDDALEYAILPKNDSKKKNKTAQYNTTVESEGISGNTYSASSNVSVIAKKTQFITIVAMTK